MSLSLASYVNPHLLGSSPVDTLTLPSADGPSRQVSTSEKRTIKFQGSLATEIEAEFIFLLAVVVQFTM